MATLVRETVQLHQRLRSDLVLAAALLHDVGRIRELGPGPAFRPTDEGRLLGHVHLGLRLIEERAGGLEAAVRAELLHAVASHHDRNAARTAEAAVLFHANQLDAVAASNPSESRSPQRFFGRVAAASGVFARCASAPADAHPERQ